MAKRKSKTKHPKLPNGFGRITEIKGRNLRNPFRAMVTVGKNEEGRPIGKILGYYESWYAAYDALREYHENPYELKKDNLTMEELYQKWSESYFEELTDETSIRTIKSAWSYVTPTFRRQIAVAVTPQAMKDFITNDAQRKDKDGKTIMASENTKARIKSIFNLMYDYAVLANIIEYNPARQFSLKGIQGKIERKRKDKTPFSQEHEDDLWKDIDFGYTKMVLINIYTGWRPEEMLELEKKNIDLENMTMTGGMKTDAGYDRTIPIHPKILPLVEYYYNLSDGEMLFYDYSKVKPSTMTYDKYRGRFRKILERHGWEDIYTPSCPRHTFSTKAKKEHMDEYARKKIMGHAVTDVTDKHYTHLDMNEYLMEEIKKI